jgi:flagellar hook-associated protein 3 FlgL
VKTTFISTQAVSNAMRISIMKMQAELATSQQEVARGRWADVGLALGSGTGQVVSLRQEHTRLNTIIDTNGLISSRLDTSQEALTGLLKTADSFLSSLISVRDGDAGPQVVGPEARNNLEALIAGLNSTLNGQYIFAGINTDVRPIADYFQTPAAANKLATDTAFFAAFGMAQTDPAVANISAADMQTFLDASFANLFDGPQWAANWSSASDQNIRSRISSNELVETSIHANQPAFQKLAMAYTMVVDLGAQNLNQDAFKAVIDTAARAIGEAIQQMTGVQARLGTAQERVVQANERMSLQIDLLSTRINGLETVDPYEVSTRITTLMTQIETAYALTARIQQLGLLKYL